MAAARAAAIPWALSWFGGSAHDLVPDVLCELSAVQKHWAVVFREVVQRELQVR